MPERSELSQNTLDHAQLAAVRFGQFKLFCLGARRCAVVLRTLFSDGNIKTVVEYWSCRGGRAGGVGPVGPVTCAGVQAPPISASPRNRLRESEWTPRSYVD